MIKYVSCDELTQPDDLLIVPILSASGWLMQRHRCLVINYRIVVVPDEVFVEKIHLLIAI